MAEFKISDPNNALDRLRALPEDALKKGFRSSMRKGANYIRDKVKEGAQQIDDPASAESIAKNVAVRFSSSAWRQRRDIEFRVGILGGARSYGNTAANRRAGRAGQQYNTGGSKGNPGGDTWYWRFQEFGRGPVRLKHRAKRTSANRTALYNAESGEFFGKEVRQARARPFMRPALANNTDQAISIIVKEMDRYLTRYAKKQG